MSAHPKPTPDPEVLIAFRLKSSTKRKLKAKLAAHDLKLVDFFREAVERYLKESK
jgi:hypothetical protein